MSNPIFHHKLQQPSVADPGHLELGNQLLAFLKLFIYCLVAFKFFQLIFLKFKKQLSVSDRVQKKYKYSHGELLQTYTQSEAKLMEMTINNTIKNAQVMPSEGLGRRSKKAKQVSFKEENNCYHSIISTRNCSETDEEEFKDLEIQSKLFKDSCESQSQFTEAEADAKMGEQCSKLPLIAEGEQWKGVGVQKESQLSQQTQASVVLEGKQGKGTANLKTNSQLAIQQNKVQ